MHTADIVIVDYGMGNVFSMLNALKHLGADAVISSDHQTIRAARVLILPGVGAFPAAMKHINQLGLRQLIIDHVAAGKVLVGICLGHQLLFDGSSELGGAEGLGILRGNVVPLGECVEQEDVIIPNVGWYSVKCHVNDNALYDIIANNMFYFSHSYVATLDADYMSSQLVVEGVAVCASVHSDNIVGFQFHPEKSGPDGLLLLNRCLKKRIASNVKSI